MSCGIICRRDIDDPIAKFRRIRDVIDEEFPDLHYEEPGPDPFERWLILFMGVACVITGVIVLGLLAYGIVSTIVAVV